MKKAIFPGSFDPITLGHVDIINRGVTLFAEIIIAIGENSSKDYMFSIDERVAFIESAFKDNPKISVMNYSGLTIDFCKEIGVDFIVRGLRNPADFEFEKAIAHIGKVAIPSSHRVATASAVVISEGNRCPVVSGRRQGASGFPQNDGATSPLPDCATIAVLRRLVRCRRFLLSSPARAKQLPVTGMPASEQRRRQTLRLRGTFQV